jgi:hypothetical protein
LMRSIRRLRSRPLVRQKSGPWFPCGWTTDCRFGLRKSPAVANDFFLKALFHMG